MNRIKVIEIINLIHQDRPLEALELAKGEEGEIFRILQEKLETKLEHILDWDIYKEKYRDDPMNWRPEYIWGHRYSWVFWNLENSNIQSYLDLGCYEGSLVRKVASELEVRSVGVEICKEAVDWNNSRGGGEFICSSIEEFETDERFDAVSCLEVIEHVPDDRKIIDKMLELLKPGGWGYITTPNGIFDVVNTMIQWYTPGLLFDHVRCYDKESLQKLIGKDAEIVDADVFLYARFKKL